MIELRWFKRKPCVPEGSGMSWYVEPRLQWRLKPYVSVSTEAISNHSNNEWQDVLVVEE